MDATWLVSAVELIELLDLHAHRIRDPVVREVAQDADVRS